MTRQDLDKAAATLYEQHLDYFFNYISTQRELPEVLWTSFDCAKEYKNAARTAVFIRKNQWKRHIFRLMENGNIYLDSVLLECAKQLLKNRDIEIGADQYDNLDQ